MMYKRRLKKLQTALHFVEFDTPFAQHLRADDRWVQMAPLIPWEKHEYQYLTHFSERGNDTIPFRVALGSLIIQEVLKASDREVVLQIRENPYLQYFLGFERYSDTEPFHHSMMTHFRKRIPLSLLDKINRDMVSAHLKVQESKNESPENTTDTPETPSGKLLIDATCVPEDIAYPRDLSLLNKAREITERVIDRLWHSIPSSQKRGRRKPRTHRKKARRGYLAVCRRKKAPANALRSETRRQLGYIKRNRATIDHLLGTGASMSALDHTLAHRLLVSAEVHRQQNELFALWGTPGRRIDNRIVSIAKPHVRPIVRGKAAAPVEFGAKISASLIDGYILIDKVSHDSFNESGDLIMQVERYREMCGHYPASVHADKIYQTRANRAWCKERGIRLSGVPLGRPLQDKEIAKEIRALMASDARDRIPIEGAFGVGKRRYSMGRLMTRLPETSETVIGVIALTMNMAKILRDLFLSFFRWVISGVLALRNDAVTVTPSLFPLHFRAA